MLGFHLPTPASLEHGNFRVASGLVEQGSCFHGTATSAAHHAKPATGGSGCGDEDNAKPEVGGFHEDGQSAGACLPGGPDPDSTKRKRSNEDVLRTDQGKEPDVSTGSPDGSERSNGAGGDENGPVAGAKRKGKGAKESDEPLKEGYIHVRARKGQATNNHSLAERLRREKINERMKLLQDLVPGCSKVTGKAVMLDEIINYVQSLQRQVEFLSMKLATVNPQLDLTIEGLLSKDLIRFPGAPSSAPIGLSFSQEIMPKLQLLSESGMLQGGVVHGLGNSNAFRTVMQEQLHEKEFREHVSQMPHSLDGLFHRAGQLAYRSAASPEIMSIKPDQDGFHI
ncbi:hypothetical protein PR202_ga21335 [Eleusine coracana subsp. coracana]|uniref:BHLH domain-containing protein n=1 Tax=Eleusine coracana subsp. coracana TaxID=191504 RepID=A0AAV5CZN6_ELECO|nr:hypothetical protein QOZ80_8AG0635210 [Eleusine coracana subsp. coracana]GJN03849.1 hypothetical protein PR202_ga21335 [Eleusine coracana subsp. coracana]